MELRRYMPRETIFREGEYGSNFYEVRSGSVGIYAAWDGETRELDLTADNEKIPRSGGGVARSAGGFFLPPPGASDGSDAGYDAADP